MQRADAIDHTKSIIVRAPAGSGKTELLVQRYLALLARSCDDPSQIIAITFTRKAAAEMRNRIRRELARSAEPEEEHKKETYKLAQEVLAKVNKKKWHKSTWVTEENVTTIDAFCHTLVSLDPHKGDFLAMPEVLTDRGIENLYNKASREAIDFMKGDGQHREDIMHLLYIHNNSVNALVSSISKILANRVQAEDLTTANFKKYNPQQSLDLLLEELIGGLIGDMPEDLMDSISRFSGITPKKSWQEASLTDWQQLAEFLLTGGGSLRKRISSDNPADKEDIKSMINELRAPDHAAWIERLAQSRGWCKEYTSDEIDSAKAGQKLIFFAMGFLSVLFKQENKSDYSEIMLAATKVMTSQEEGAAGSDAPSILAERLDYALKHILVDEFQDTSKRQLALLERIILPWDVSTGNSIFVVGDPMQSIYAFRQADVRIFNKLWTNRRIGQVPLETITLKDNYRSQEKIVSWLNEKFEGIFPAEPNNLINAVNYSPAESTKDAEAEPVHLCCGYEKSILPEQRFYAMLQELKKLQKNEPDASIGILIRSRKHSEDLIPLLQRENIDFDAVELSSIADNPIIMDLRSLTRALYDLTDDIAWYACLRAPWCGLALNDILALSQMKQQDDKKSIWTLLKAIVNGSASSLSDDGRKRIIQFVRSVEPAIFARQRLSWSEVINRAWHGLNGAMLIRGPKDEADLQVFMDILLQHSEGGELHLADLMEQVDYSKTSFPSSAKIKILTIHSAKGLEFDYVFIINMDKIVGGVDSSLINMSNFMLKSQKEISVIGINSQNVSKDDEPVNRMIKSLQKKQDDQEMRRLFYVAASRARKALFLHYAAKLKKDGGYTIRSNSFLSLIYNQEVEEKLNLSLKANSQNGDISLARDDEAVNNSLIRRIKSEDLMDIAPSPAGSSSSQKDSSISESRATRAFPIWQSPYERSKGTAIHLLMQLLAERDKSEIDALKKTMEPGSKDSKNNKEVNKLWLQIKPQISHGLRQEAMEKASIAKLEDEIYGIMSFCLQDEKASWILEADGMNELSLIDKSGKQLRLDRMFVDNQTLWIVDYKTTSKERWSDEDLIKFKQQLEGYAKTIDMMQQSGDYTQIGNSTGMGIAQANELKGTENSKLPIKLGVYCPQDGFWQEWSY